MSYRLHCQCGFWTRYRLRFALHNRRGCAVFPPIKAGKA